MRKPPLPPSFNHWLSVLVMTLLYLLLIQIADRSAFDSVVIPFLGLFMAYGGYVMNLRSNSIRQYQPIWLLFGAAIFFRCLFLLTIPRLSDDVYRFVWDGRLLANGFNPYLYLPGALVNTKIATMAGLDVTLFQKLNSPNYFTVYPPVNQALFGLAAWLSKGSFFWNVVWLRVPIVLSEIGTGWLMMKLLRRSGRNPNLALLYGLNPLVIIELTGNLHYEAVMIFFVLLAVWLVNHYAESTRGLVLSAGVLAMGIATKLLPLLLLPLAIWYLGWRRGVAYSVLTGGFTALLFAPFASVELVQNVSSSVGLYFQKFEFNASIYYLLREIGYWIEGYNTIAYVGFGLSITTTLGIVWIAFRWKNPSMAVKLLTTLTLYFALATTVHPWYICSIVAAAVFTRFRYPLVWSALIPVSYFTYYTLPYHENLWLTALEYGVVAITLIAEMRIGERLPHPAEVD